MVNELEVYKIGFSAPVYLSKTNHATAVLERHTRQENPYVPYFKSNISFINHRIILFHELILYGSFLEIYVAVFSALVRSRSSG